MTQTLFPTLRYRDAPAALAFLESAFGFRTTARHDGDGGAVHHAEVTDGTNHLMLGSISSGADGRLDLPAGTGSLYVVIDDPDERFARATAAGAEVVRPLGDTDYGSREFTVRDPEGNSWSFGTYRPEAP